jgi:hypothetical protein
MAPLSVTPLVAGAQLPRISALPEFWESSGSEVVEVAAAAGLVLDPWQVYAVEQACGMREDGQWSAFQVGINVARQNGKGSILEARELAGIFAFGERLIVHSAHEQATSSEHFRRLLDLIEGVPDFDQRVLKISRGKGMEGIELRGGQRILFKTRTGGGGRGFTGDFVVLDEAMILPDKFMAALVPTMAATSKTGNPQLWLTGSSVDQMNPNHDGVVFARLRKRALEGVERMAWMEWSAPGESPEELTGEQMGDPEMWALGNPGLGIRITEEYVRAEKNALRSREFAVERLGVGDWPSVDEQDDDGIRPELWSACLDVQSMVPGLVRFALDVKPDRSRAAVCVGGVRADGLRHMAVVKHDAGTGWVVDELKALMLESDRPVLIDSGGPAAAMIKELEEARIPLEKVDGREYSQACGALFDDVANLQVRHIGQPELTAAAMGASKRPLGDAWAWSRKTSAVDISPLVGCTLALWGARDGASVYSDRGVTVI